MTSLPASDPGSAAVWSSKRINPRPQSCLCLTWSGYPSNDDDDDEALQYSLFSFQHLEQPHVTFIDSLNSSLKRFTHFFSSLKSHFHTILQIFHSFRPLLLATTENDFPHCLNLIQPTLILAATAKNFHCFNLSLKCNFFKFGKPQTSSDQNYLSLPSHISHVSIFHISYLILNGSLNFFLTLHKVPNLLIHQTLF